MTDTISRRSFLALAGGLLLTFHLPALAANGGDGQVFAPNAFLHVGEDDIVTVVVGRSEMGQGVLTSLPMIVAEDMEADFARVRSEQAPADAAFNTPGGGMQLTGGSSSVRSFYDVLRLAGATARDMLIAAAAATWGVSATDCRAAKSQVLHHDGRRASFGSLARKAAQQDVPAHPALKPASQFKLIGQPAPRLDVVEKVNGGAQFGLDIRLPGMLYASVLRCPVFGGSVKSVDDSAARQVAGVRNIVRIANGVAVVATAWWTARSARDKLKVVWDAGPAAHLSTDDIWHQYEAAAQHDGTVAVQRGDAARAVGTAKRQVEAVYRLPYLAHATMEPMNCTADVRADAAEVWSGTQAQTLAVGTVCRITGLPPGAVHIHTTLLGGGFGRRAEQDFIADAVELSKAVAAPVKVVYTREEDMQHDFYRPLCYHHLKAGLDGSRISGWWHRMVTQSILGRFFPFSVKDVDRTSVEGAANQPYDVDALRVECITPELAVPVGFWRSVGASHNAFVVESFMDELAHAAGVDPYRFRHGLLTHSPRHQRVLDVAAEKAGWGRPLPAGWGRGIAVAESFETYVAQVVEVEVPKTGAPRVHRVVVAVDCGPVINPDTVVAQMEGGMVYGLSAALYGQITLSNGRVDQNNFNDYPVLRMNEMPRHVEVHIVPNGEHLGGVGEPGVPPIAPAVTNAIFAATGKRIRTLPIAPV